MSHRTILATGPDALLLRLRAGLNHAADHCAQAVRKWRRVRRSRTALATLDDRLLRDIGVTRHQVELAERVDEFPRWR